MSPIGISLAMPAMGGTGGASTLPVFNTQPTLDATDYLSGATVTRTLGTSDAGTTITVESFTLGGVDKESEVASNQWDTTGESRGTISFQCRVTDDTTSAFRLSNVITANLAELPAAMAADTNFTVTNDGTGGDATLSLVLAPDDGGYVSGITDYEYKIGAGAWTSAGLLAAPLALTGLFTDGAATDVYCRAVAAGNGPDGTADSVTTTDIPGAMVADTNFTVADATTGGDATLTLDLAPAANGDTITDYEYRIGAGGSWVSAGMLGSPLTLSDLFTDGVSTDVYCRAVSATGNGPDGTADSVTTTEAAPTVTAMTPSTQSGFDVPVTATDLDKDAPLSRYIITSAAQTTLTAQQIYDRTDENDAAPLDFGDVVFTQTTGETQPISLSAFDYEGSVYIYFVLITASGVRSVVEGTGAVSIDTGFPAFATWPTLDAGSYSIGDNVTITPGTSYGGRTVTTEYLRLGTTDKTSEIVSDVWDTTGESAETIYYAERVTNDASGEYNISGEITATLIASGDVTDPTFTLDVATQASDGDVLITLSEISEDTQTAYLIVTSSAQTTLTAAQVVAGTDEGDAAAADDASFAISESSTTASGAIASGLSGNYYINVVLRDLAGNDSDPVEHGPYAIKTTAPTLSSAVPADNATDIAIDTTIALTFDATIAAAASGGEFYLYSDIDTTPVLVETFDCDTLAGDDTGSIAFSGAVVTITPGNDLSNSKQYSVRWNAGAVTDAVGNPVAANTGDTTYNFTTVAAASGLTIVSSGLLGTESVDRKTLTFGNTATVASGDLIVVGIAVKKTSNSDSDITVDDITYNSSSLTVDVNNRLNGSDKLAIIMASGVVSGTNASVYLDCTNNAVNLEAIAGYYWVISGQHATHLDTSAVAKNESTADDDMTLAVTTGYDGCLLLGAIGLDTGSDAPTATISSGTEDGQHDTGAGAQDLKGIFAHNTVTTAGAGSIAYTFTDEKAIGAVVSIRKA